MDDIIFNENEDWEKRILCSDESCIGTIGSDGKCKECGRIFEGELPAGHGTSDSKPKVAPETVQPDADTYDDWEKRVLCSDESCIGIIGLDGKCKECGKPAGK